MLIELPSKLIQSLSSIPILGPVVEQFAAWCQSRSYALTTIENKLFYLRHLALYFKRLGVRRWKDLNREYFEQAWERL